MKRLLLLLCLVLLLPVAAAAVQVPARPPARVTDLAGILSIDQRQAIDDRLAAFERETTSQVAVLTIPSLEGEPIESFSHRIATTWKLGRAGIDNGVLLLIAVQDRRARIEVGYGLEPVLPDGLAGAIIRESLAPYFRRGDYAGGINAALDRILPAARKADLAAVPARRTLDAHRSLAGRLAVYLLFGLAVFGLAYPLNRRFMGKTVWSALGLSGAGLAGGALAGFLPWGFLAGLGGLAIGLAAVEAFVEEQWRCPRCGGWLRRTAAIRGASEIVTAACPRCGFATRAVRDAVAAAAGAGAGYWLGGGGQHWGGGMGGGGDSGFSGGGGDFGGGGASGSW